MTPLWVVTNSTISCSAARFTSFHFRSERGSATKSKRTQHCRIFCTNSSSRSFDVASATRLLTLICAVHGEPYKRNKARFEMKQFQAAFPIKQLQMNKKNHCITPPRKIVLQKLTNSPSVSPEIPRFVHECVHRTRHWSLP